MIVLSYSQGDILEGCTLRYWHQYVAKTPRKLDCESAEIFILGSAVHKGFHEWYVAGEWSPQVVPDGVVALTKRMISAYDHEVHALRVEHGVRIRPDKIQRDRQVIPQHAAALLRLLKDNGLFQKQMLSEQKLFRMLNKDVGFLAYADLIVRTSPAEVVIVDFKTGKEGSRKFLSETQLRLYAAAVSLIEPRVRVPRVAFVLTALNEVLLYEVSSRGTLLREFGEWVGDKYAKARLVYDRVDAPSPTVGAHCWICPYKSVCPAQREVLSHLSIVPREELEAL